MKTLAELKKDRLLKRQQNRAEYKAKKAEQFRLKREEKRIERIKIQKVKEEEKKKLKQKEKDERVLLSREQGLKVDSLGRVLTWAPTESDWIERKELILNCGIDVTKFGWVGKVEKATGLTKRIIERTVEHFSLKVFKRKVY